MSWRAIILGLSLGLLVSALTHYNDMVVRQTFLISNHLPIAIFGSLVLLTLGLNPLLRLIGVDLPLRGTELAIIVAVSLTACGWPSFNYYRYALTIPAMPAHWAKTNAAWRSSDVMAYVPGGAARVAEGHVRDWRALSTWLAGGGQDSAVEGQEVQGNPGGETTMAGRVWSRFAATTRRQTLMLADATRTTAVTADERRAILRDLNAALADPTLSRAMAIDDGKLTSQGRHLLRERSERVLEEHEVVRLHRWLLVAELPEVVLPPPRGGGVLLAGGRTDEPALDAMLVGGVTLGDLPWRAWWPTLRLWGTMALLLGGAAVCLALIVHPQWSQRELLAYPIARFVAMISERSPGAALPAVATSGLFWWGVGAVLALHALNGLGAWFPGIPTIPLTYDFTPMQQVFPNAAQAPGARDLFRPTVYLTVVAFCFYLTSSVSLSLGLSHIAHVAFGALMIGYGVSMTTDVAGGGPGNLIRFGAYVGMGLLIVYVGRRYYGQLIIAAVSTRRFESTPPYTVWATRGLLLCIVLGVYVMYTAGVTPVFALLFILLTLLTFVVLSRLVAESGLFFVQVWWMPAGVLAALLGVEAIGPTDFIVLGIASIMLVGDPRTAVMPYIVHALRIGEQAGRTRPALLTPWIGVMLTSGFAVATVATFAVTYRYGINFADGWDVRRLPSMPFDRLLQHIADLSQQQALAEATTREGWARVAAIRPEPGALRWAGLGLVLLVVTSLLRLHVPRWPIHPVLFLVWGTMPGSRFWASFMIGWAIRWAVTATVGDRGYRAMSPLMIGIIAGELAAGLGWVAVGWIYHAGTGMPPATYRIFP
jgi:hypothetical protein